MAKKKEGRRLTIEFDPDVREIIEEVQQQRGLLSFKDANQAIVRDWKRKTQKSIAQDMEIENKTEPIEPSLNSLSDEQETALAIPQEETIEKDYIDCNLLCKKARSCTSNAMNSKGEIDARNCYQSAFPYQFHTPQGKIFRLCPFMQFSQNYPNNPYEPYPTCIAKQIDIPFNLPKDRTMRNPQLCWNCYMARKEMRQKEREDQRFRGQPRVDWHQAEGFDAFKLGDNP